MRLYIAMALAAGVLITAVISGTYHRNDIAIMERSADIIDQQATVITSLRREMNDQRLRIEQLEKSCNVSKPIVKE